MQPHDTIRHGQCKYSMLPLHGESNYVKIVSRIIQLSHHSLSHIYSTLLLKFFVFSEFRLVWNHCRKISGTISYLEKIYRRAKKSKGLSIVVFAHSLNTFLQGVTSGWLQEKWSVSRAKRSHSVFWSYIILYHHNLAGKSQCCIYQVLTEIEFETSEVKNHQDFLATDCGKLILRRVFTMFICTNCVKTFVNRYFHSIFWTTTLSQLDNRLP